MAQVINTMPEARKGRPPIYPWAEWLDGRVWVLTQGEDFSVSLQSMGVMVRDAAAKHGKKATVLRDTEAGTITLQARNK